MKRLLGTLLVTASLVATASADEPALGPAQAGLSGWLSMRSPSPAAVPQAYGAFRYADMIDGIGTRTILSAGYNRPWGENGEWGVQLPVAFTTAGTGLHQTFLGAKYRFFDADNFEVGSSGYLLLPASIGVSDTGTGQFGLGGELELLFRDYGVELGINSSVERADYCAGCRRPIGLDDARAVTGVDVAVGLRVPIDVHAVIAEYHLNWNKRGDEIDDGDIFAQIGGQVAITEEFGAKLFVGSGFNMGRAHKNTEAFGGLTAVYRFAGEEAPAALVDEPPAGSATGRQFIAPVQREESDPMKEDAVEPKQAEPDSAQGDVVAPAEDDAAAGDDAAGDDAGEEVQPTDE